MPEATWTNGKTELKGRWQYNWGSYTFTIEIDKKDPITGSRTRNFTTHNDTPEWGKYKLKR